MDLLERNSVLNVNDESDSCDDWICVVCLSDETETDCNLLVLCGGCGLSVHQDCYGIDNVPEREWFCDVCVSQTKFKRIKMKCELCMMVGGCGFMSSDGKVWRHALCSLAARRFPSDEDSEIHLRNRKCSICKVDNGGICVSCHKCIDRFHPICGQNAGFKVDIGFFNKNICVEFVCSRHIAKLQLQANLERLEQRNGMDPAIVTKRKYPVVQANKLMELKEKCTILCGDDGWLFDRVHMYWFLKRCDRNGEPLKKCCRDELDNMDEQPDDFSELLLKKIVARAKMSERIGNLRFLMAKQKYEIMKKVIEECVIMIEETGCDVRSMRSKLENDEYVDFEQFKNDCSKTIGGQKMRVRECLESAESMYRGIIKQIASAAFQEDSFNENRRISRFSIGSGRRKSIKTDN